MHRQFWKPNYGQRRIIPRKGYPGQKRSEAWRGEEEQPERPSKTHQQIVVGNCEHAHAEMNPTENRRGAMDFV